VHLLKRNAFEHEAEVRVILIPQGSPQPREGFPRGWYAHVARQRCQHRSIYVPIDPNKLFDEVTFDPRLRPVDFKERKDFLQRCGYPGEKIQWPDLYKFVHLHLEILLKPSDVD
jgi:hypothetical protein